MLRKYGECGEQTIKWEDDNTRMVYQLALLGLTDEEMAKVLDISVATFDVWKRERPEFREALIQGKMIADGKVVESFFKRACGFTVKETLVFCQRGEIIEHVVDKYYPPDSWAAAKWLALRQRAHWTDVQRIEQVNTNINITKIDLKGFTVEELALIEKMGMLQLTENAGGN